jgi:hypothetical protein
LAARWLSLPRSDFHFPAAWPRPGSCNRCATDDDALHRWAPRLLS